MTAEQRRARRNAQRNERRRTEPFFRRRVDLKQRVFRSIVRGIDDPRLIPHLGCRVTTTRGHLEAQFERGMSWANYGAWHIDHRIPKVEFYKAVERGDLSEDECFRRVHHYTKLQPKWARDNLLKGASHQWQRHKRRRIRRR
jgi:hypothetical protein